MEWTCDVACWCHIPVQSQRGPPCYQCVLRNCSFTYPMRPKPSAPPLSESPAYMYLEPQPQPQPQLVPRQHLRSPAPPLPPPLRKRSIKGKTEIQECLTTQHRSCLHVDPDPIDSDVAAAVRETEDYFGSFPVAQTELESEGAAVAGLEESHLQGNSHDVDMRIKNESTNLSELLRELLLDDENTASEGAEAPCVLRDNNTSPTENGNSLSVKDFVHGGTSLNTLSDSSQISGMRVHDTARWSGGCSFSMPALTLDGPLDEEAYRRINKINRRESWKCAEQRHMLDSASELSAADP